MACSSRMAWGLSSLDGVGHRDDAQQAARPAEEQGRFALCGEGCGLLLQLCRHGDFGSDKGRIAAKDLHAVQLCGQTVARQGGKTGYLGAVKLLRSVQASTALASGCSLCAPVRRQG